MSNDNRDKLSYIAGRYGQIVKFHNVEVICAEEISHLKKVFEAEINRFNRENVYTEVKLPFHSGKLYRLMIPQILPNDIEKVIYLDSDIIVNLDIAELWQINLDDKPLAAVPEREADIPQFEYRATYLYLITHKFVSFENYFNSGVLIMNLKHLKNDREILMEGIQFRLEHPQCQAFDQDILNYCFANDYLQLAKKFDKFIGAEHLAKRNVQNAIYHFTGPAAMSLNFNDDFSRLWFSYFEKTPWFTKNVIGRIDEGYRQIINQRDAGLKNLAIQLSALMSGKTRAFFIPAQNVDYIKEVFLIRDDEEIIPLDTQASFNTLVKSMNESRGKKIFFILSEDYSQLRDELIQEGFVEGEDFINAVMFATYANGVPLNTHELIRNM